MTRHQAHRTLRLDARYVGLALLLLSAALTVAVLWFAMAMLLSFGSYIESLPL